MTEEERSRSYYSKKELEIFALEPKVAKTLSQELPGKPPTCSVHTKSESCFVGLEISPALRGLELYVCPIRVRNKLLAKKALLKYNKQLNRDINRTREKKLQSLAAASATLNRWSTSVSLETARLDSLGAYECDYMISINDPVLILPFPAIYKRRRDTFSEETKPSRKRSK